MHSFKSYKRENNAELIMDHTVRLLLFNFTSTWNHQNYHEMINYVDLKIIFGYTVFSAISVV